LGKKAVIGIVGPCGAGKTTLTSHLLESGYNARHIAQEHSYVKDMWKRITNPEVLIYLEVAYPITIKRRNLDWTEMEYLVQIKRLEHARENADLIVDTNLRSAEEVFEIVQYYLTHLIKSVAG
jgi:adenylate kinase family enzyme